MYRSSIYLRRKRRRIRKAEFTICICIIPWSKREAKESSSSDSSGLHTDDCLLDAGRQDLAFFSWSIRDTVPIGCFSRFLSWQDGLNSLQSAGGVGFDRRPGF